MQEVSANVFPPETYDVVIVNIDALRADHLPCYGYRRNTAPGICGLAEEGVLFERAYAHAPWTLPSVASLFTGNNPMQHGVQKRLLYLPPRRTTVPELFKQSGYRTAAFVEGGFFGPYFRLLQGYEETERWNDPKLSSDQLVDRAIGFLDTPRDRPRLVYVHPFDVHAPYRPPNRTYNRWQPERRPLNLSDDRFGELGAYQGNISEAALRQIEASYDGSIRYTDKQVSRLISAIKADGNWEDTVFVVTADHGESFKDHSQWVGHTHHLYDEYVRVPLLIHHPDMDARRIQKPFGQASLMPLLRDLADVRTPAGAEDILQDAVDAASPIFLSRAKLGDQKTAVVRGHLKLILTSERRMLYNLSADPSETNNIRQEHPDIQSDMLEQLKRRMMPSVAGVNRSMPAEVRRRLEALGYME